MTARLPTHRPPMASVRFSPVFQAPLIAAILVAAIQLAAGQAKAQADARPAATLSLSTGSPAVSAKAEARGVLKPWRETRFSVEITARIQTLPLRVGDGFKEGDLLIGFDCGRLEAELKAARATEAEHTALHRTTTLLRQHKAAGANELEVAKARLDKARADVEGLSHRTGQCAVKAPFDGRVVERLVDVHEIPQPNQPLLKVVDAGRAEAALVVPSAWLAWLKPGMATQFQLDDTGETLSGSVARLGAQVDAGSQTVEVFVTLDDGGATALPGMAGIARFPLVQAKR